MTQTFPDSLLMKDKETVDHSSNNKYQLLKFQFLYLHKVPNLQDLQDLVPAALEQLNLNLIKDHEDSAEEPDVPSVNPVHVAP